MSKIVLYIRAVGIFIKAFFYWKHYKDVSIIQAIKLAFLSMGGYINSKSNTQEDCKKKE